MKRTDHVDWCAPECITLFSSQDITQSNIIIGDTLNQNTALSIDGWDIGLNEPGAATLEA